MRSEKLRGLPGAVAISLMALLMLGAFGCAANSGNGHPDDSTTRAMADPMQYSPPDDSDISGGGIADFNSKAFHKDMDHVVNP